MLWHWMCLQKFSGVNLAFTIHNNKLDMTYQAPVFSSQFKKKLRRSVHLRSPVGYKLHNAWFRPQGAQIDLPPLGSTETVNINIRAGRSYHLVCCACLELVGQGVQPFFLRCALENNLRRPLRGRRGRRSSG